MNINHANRCKTCKPLANLFKLQW